MTLRDFFLVLRFVSRYWWQVILLILVVWLVGSAALRVSSWEAARNEARVTAQAARHAANYRMCFYYRAEREVSCQRTTLRRSDEDVFETDRLYALVRDGRIDGTWETGNEFREIAPAFTDLMDQLLPNRGRVKGEFRLEKLAYEFYAGEIRQEEGNWGRVGLCVARRDEVCQRYFLFNQLP